MNHHVNGPALETLDWPIRVGQLTNAYGQTSDAYGVRDATTGHITGIEFYQYRALFRALHGVHYRGLRATGAS